MGANTTSQGGENEEITQKVVNLLPAPNDKFNTFALPRIPPNTSVCLILPDMHQLLLHNKSKVRYLLSSSYMLSTMGRAKKGFPPTWKQLPD